jgi:hypothetical protein
MFVTPYFESIRAKMKFGFLYARNSVVGLVVVMINSKPDKRKRAVTKKVENKHEDQPKLRAPPGN